VWRRHLLLWPLGFLLAALLYLLAFETQLGVPVYNAGSVFYFTEYKLQAARRAASPKILIISGSNGHFGISAEQIQKSTGRPTINLAVFAGCTSDFLLWNLQRTARPGDIVLLPLEYSYYQKQIFGGELFHSYLLAHEADYVRHLPLAEHLQLLLETKPFRIFLGHFSRWSSHLLLPKESFLRHLNANGDEIMNQPSDQTPAYHTALEKFPGISLETYGAEVPSIQGLRRLAAWCRDNHVTLLATYPSLLQNPIYTQPRFQEFFSFIQNFWHEQSIPILGTANQFMYPLPDFFDTEYHLNAPARTRRTETILQLLQPYLNPGP
jgi:hypothetical protein